MARPVGVWRNGGRGYAGVEKGVGGELEGAAREWAGRWIGMEGILGVYGTMT